MAIGHHSHGNEVVSQVVKSHLGHSCRFAGQIEGFAGSLAGLVYFFPLGTGKEPLAIGRFPGVDPAKVGFQVGIEIDGAGFVVFGESIGSNYELLWVKVDIPSGKAADFLFPGTGESQQAEVINE